MWRGGGKTRVAIATPDFGIINTIIETHNYKKCILLLLCPTNSVSIHEDGVRFCLVDMVSYISLVGVWLYTKCCKED